MTSGQPPAQAAPLALPEWSNYHCLLVCVWKKISASPSWNILQRGKLGWGNIWLWCVWGRGRQTGSEKAGKSKSLQLPTSNRHPPLLPGLWLYVARKKWIPDTVIFMVCLGAKYRLCSPSWSCQYWTWKMEKKGLNENLKETKLRSWLRVRSTSFRVKGKSYSLFLSVDARLVWWESPWWIFFYN